MSTEKKIELDSWEALILIEPRLIDVVEQAAKSHGKPYQRYESAKRKLNLLVGWNAKIPELQSSEVYEICIIHLARELGV